jgi:hypothetical protein
MSGGEVADETEQGAQGRGNIGRQTYERVRELLDSGDLTTRAAFERVAEETGRSVGTVQTAYYRVARSMPGGGGVKQRPRGGRTAAPSAPRGRGGRRRASAGGDVDQLIRDVQRSLDALVARVRQLEGGQRELRDQAKRYDEIRRILRT